jgi:Tol biopolymer transport system component
MLLHPAFLKAQYFGRNKPQYRSFKYDVTKTPNFELYTYLENDSFVNNFTQSAEEWFSMHQKIFKDTFEYKNPLILYSTHADFQQTNAVSGQISTSTGGVTESLKNRVIMPIAPTMAQTDHVLGHELVHAFQFNTLLKSDSVKNYDMKNLPLWMIEGMAEYFSIGSVDPNTAMWMRDALVNDDFPTLKQLSTESKYFPYRYGHAFWSMIGKTWGDTLIIPVFELTAQYGLDKALDSLLGFDSKTLSGLWKNSMETHYGKYINDSTEYIAGEKLISAENAGRMNLSPSLSPDGNYLAFFSQKSVFTLDLYLADTKSGKIIKKLSSITRNHEIDDFSFVESAGTWSPDSKKFAFVVFRKGKNMLAIVDVKRSRIIDEIELGRISSFSNPEWSPDGNYIVFSGLVNGIGDLYLYDLRHGIITKLTDDPVSNIHPSWSPDGNYIVCSTEKINNSENTKKFSFDLHIIDVRTKEVKKLDIFPGADNLNPQFASNENSIYFLSNADGFRNLYHYKLDSQIVYRLTEYNTGISGLTAFSPAISSARLSDLLAYTHYFKNSYEIYLARDNDFRYQQVDRNAVDFAAGTLPPLDHYYANVIDSALYSRDSIAVIIPVDSIEEVPYKPKFKLDYISNTAGIGVTTSRYGNNNMGGSVTMIFSDIVGNNQLYSVLALNGEIYDFGGQIAYINNTKRFNWGAYVSHIPYRYGNLSYLSDTLTFKEEDEEIKLPVINMQLDYWRMFEDNISLFTYHAFSQTRRIEAGLSAAWYYYRIDRYNSYFDEYGSYIGVNREKVPAPGGNNYQKIDIAFVQDNSYFGMTSPLRGGRARVQVEKYFGAVNFFTGLIDYRKYYFINPLTFAFRLYHYGRYGKTSDSDIVSPVYIGYPWLVRGYENLGFYNNNNMFDMGMNSYNYSLLSGSKAFVGNAELRLPLTGPKSLALFRSKYFLTDLNFFFDSGLAWHKWSNIKIAWEQNSFDDRIPVFSTGASLRVNVLGYLVVELYYAIPFQNGGWENGVFGINFVPGW